MSAWPDYSECLCHRRPVVRNVLDNLVENDHVERSVAKWQMFAGSQKEATRCLGALAETLSIDIDTERRARDFLELSNVDTQPAADVEDTSTLKRRMALDEIEAAVLSEPPDEAWISERDFRPLGRADHKRFQAPCRFEAITRIRGLARCERTIVEHNGISKVLRPGDDFRANLPARMLISWRENSNAKLLLTSHGSRVCICRIQSWTRTRNNSAR